jgi:DNA-binding transcriptional regulator GbsR (MarR family)
MSGDLPDPDEYVASAIGRLMAFWGFRLNLGRIWSFLFLSPEPLTSAELCERLKLSTGSVSTALTELHRWGAIHKHRVPGDRREHYLAEPDIWKAITRVMEQREAREVEEVLDALKTAERSAEERILDAVDDEGTLAAEQFRRNRIHELTELALAGKDLLDLVLGHEAVEDIMGPPSDDAARTERARVRIPRAPRED